MFSKNAIADIWREITTPSERSEGAYMRLLIGTGHILVGGALTGVLPPMFVAIAYILGKEVWFDWWYNRGSLRDGVHDAGAVCFGVGLAVYFGPVASVAFALSLVYAMIAAVLYGVKN